VHIVGNETKKMVKSMKGGEIFPFKKITDFVESV